MIRSALSKVTWMARATTTVVGLAIMLALVFGFATTAIGATGGNFLLGQRNVADVISTLVKKGPGPALSLVVEANQPPLKVNSSAKVANLNADKLDGKDFGAFDATTLINGPGPLPKEYTYTSKGGTLLLWASGSGFRGTGSSQKEGNIGMSVIVDGHLETVANVYTNERNSHKAFVPGYAVLSDLPAGPHTIRLDEYRGVHCNTAAETQDTYCTDTDRNDYFRVFVTEIPD